MHPVFFHVYGIPIEAFWTTVFLGFLASLLVIRSELIRLGHDAGAAYDLILWAYLGGFIGARLLLGVTAWVQCQQDPFELLFSGSGWVWQGGVMGGAVAVLWKARRLGLPLGEVADFSGMALAIGQAVGRLGCQLSGDGDYGVPTDLPWGMSYPDGVVPTTDRVHPTPVYEMVGLLAIFFWQWRRRAEPHAPGARLGEYLIASGALRFAVEFVRRNPTIALGLTIAQWVSLASIAIGAVLVWRRVPVTPQPAAA